MYHKVISLALYFSTCFINDLFLFIETAALYSFFFCLGFLSHSQFSGQQGRGEVISLATLYRFRPFYRHLDIGRTITAERSPLHLANSWTQTEDLYFLSAIH